MYSAKIILDSIGTDCWGQDVRLTTMEVVFPRFILAEFNTHRTHSRNSASSRAIPSEKLRAKVRNTPFVPESFGMNQRGMQAGAELDDRDNSKAQAAWLRGRDNALAVTEALLDQGVHKQWANRPIEPYMWHTVICSSTEWGNFFNRRNHPDAQPEMQRIAAMMEAAYLESVPVRRTEHLPYVYEDEAELPIADRLRLSTARCARVSYLTHDGRRDPSADYRLHDDLIRPGHMSPFEHPAMLRTEHPSILPRTLYNDIERVAFAGNFRLPWYQYRKTIPNEDNMPR